MGGEAFLGRERELGELRDALDAARIRRGRLVLISGEPGIGKTRLVDEFATAARAEGTPVLSGRCWEAGGAPAYWPWVQILRARMRGLPPDELRRELGAGAVDVAQMLPEVHDAIPNLEAPPSVDPESARFRLFDSTAAFLRNASAERPLVVVLEDLHAADVPSLLLLRFLTGQLSDLAVLVLATYREVELTPGHPLRQGLPDLTRDPSTVRMPLGGLAERDVGPFVEQAAGLRPGPLFISALHRETKGNPLFLAEAIRLLAAEGRLDDVPDAASLRVRVPEGVGDVIARRLDRLDEQGGRTLELAAVLGPEFPVEALARLGDMSPGAALEALDRPIADGLVERAPGSPGRMRFSHGLVRETLYRDLSAARRVALHRRAADVLEELFGNDPGHLAELAHHWYESAATGETGPAIDAAVRAGDQAARSLAYEEAVRLYRMAARLIEVSGPLDEERLGEVLLALGEAETRAGDLTDAKATMLRVAALARRTGASTQLGRAALGYGGRFVFTRAGHDARLVPLLEQALAVVDDDGLRARLLTRLACALRSSPDRAHSDRLSAEALDIARRMDDPRVLGYALLGRLFAIWWPDTQSERLALAGEAGEVAERTNDGEGAIQALLGRFCAHLELCQVAEARDVFAGMLAHAETMRQPAIDWVVRAQRNILTLLEGSFDEAEALIEDERPFSHTIPHDYLSSRRFHLFLLRREQDRGAEIEGLVRGSVEEFPWYPLWRYALACLLVDLGREEEARATFGEALRNERFALLRDNEWLLGIGLMCEASVAVGEAPVLARLYDEVLPFAERQALGNAEGSMGPLARHLGLLATAMGRFDDAERHFVLAEDLGERMGALPWLAHARHDHARMLLERDGPGDRTAARSLLERARITADRLGMVALQRRVDRLLDTSTGGPAEAEVQRPDTGAAGSAGEFLREGEYWSITFEGASVRLRDSKGMAHLARLLAEPGREFHALDLVGASASAPAASAPAAGAGVTRDAASAFGDAGSVLDPEAKAAYRRRIAELEEDVEEAEARGDADAAERARTEREFIVRELAAAVGLGGRDRVSVSASERARVNATRAIRAALARIGEQSPPLGRHLAATVRTGTYCSYVPDPRHVAAWRT